jgi:putative membrane protein
MTLRWLLASFHLLALGIGLGAVVIRGLALRSRLDGPALRWVFGADAAWGVAALLWLGTGLWRLLGGLEKGTAYYFHNHAFLTKMGLFAILFALELWPMMTLTTWRRRSARGQVPDTTAAPLLARISFWQAGLIVVMVLLATAMARGYGA